MSRLLLVFSLISTSVFAQTFTQKDSLRGALSAERSWFDVTYYHLSLEVNPELKSISGSNDLYFTVLENSNTMQLDLFENLTIDSVLYKGTACTFKRLYDAFFVDFPLGFELGSQEKISIYYNGTPVVAKNAPWDGGFVWDEDEEGLPWLGVACQGLGASSWWPCKDHLSDEPDSMRVTVAVPDKVQFIGNGNLEKDVFQNNKRISTWKISYPINTYNVSLNIANYAHIKDAYTSNFDTLDLDYYVLRGNEAIAKAHFKQVKPMLAVYEELFGPYPFWNDGYALVETSYLGMEHQSAIAYGNKFKAGYLGRHPGNMDFDFIVIHESGHEYWGNSISMNDLADMWIHESFCTYTEALYVEKIYGYNAMLEYLLYQKEFIDASSPIYGVHGLNNKGNATDMYYKGSWMLHSIRNTINNDSLWFSILKDLAQNFALQNCDGSEIIDFMCKASGLDLKPIFNQYLAFAKLPVLSYKFTKRAGKLMLFYKWSAQAENFNMPLEIYVGSEKKFRIFPKSKYQRINLGNTDKLEVSFSENLFLFEKNKD